MKVKRFSEYDPVLKVLDDIIEFIKLMREEKKLAIQEFTIK